MNDSIIIHKLSLKINNLQTSIDSLKQSSSIKQLTYELHQKQDVITQVNDFYDSAWLKLIIVISILGILVPLIAQYYQRRNLQDLTEFIRKQMNDSFDMKINELKIFNQQEIHKSLIEYNSNLKAIENKNQKMLNELDASTYYLQGRASVLSKEYSLAIPSFLKSAYLYLETERPERATVQFVNLKLCLKTITDKKIIEQSSNIIKKSSYNLTLDEMIEYFLKHSLNDIYLKHINEIILEIERIKNAD